MSLTGMGPWPPCNTYWVLPSGALVATRNRPCIGCATCGCCTPAGRPGAAEVAGNESPDDMVTDCACAMPAETGIGSMGLLGNELCLACPTGSSIELWLALECSRLPIVEPMSEASLAISRS